MWTGKCDPPNPRFLSQRIWKEGSGLGSGLRQLLQTIIVSNSFLPLYSDPAWQELSPAARPNGYLSAHRFKRSFIACEGLAVNLAGSRHRLCPLGDRVPRFRSPGNGGHGGPGKPPARFLLSRRGKVLRTTQDPQGARGQDGTLGLPVLPPWASQCGQAPPAVPGSPVEKLNAKQALEKQKWPRPPTAPAPLGHGERKAEVP